MPLDPTTRRRWVPALRWPPIMAFWLAASLSYLGREAEAKAAAAAYLERYPDFKLSEHLKTTYFKHAHDREHYAEGLRQAGMPE